MRFRNIRKYAINYPVNATTLHIHVLWQGFLLYVPLTLCVLSYENMAMWKRWQCGKCGNVENMAMWEMWQCGKYGNVGNVTMWKMWRFVNCCNVAS